MKKRILACFMCLCMVLSVAPTIVFADDIQEGEVDYEDLELPTINYEDYEEWKVPDGNTVNKEGLELKGNGDMKDYWNSPLQDPAIVIYGSGTFELTGKTGKARLEVKSADEGDVYIRIKNVTIDLTKEQMGFIRTRNAISIHENSKAKKVTVEFIGTNTIKSYMGAGIVNETNCDLNIIGTGSLTVEGGLVHIGKSIREIEIASLGLLSRARREFEEKNKTLCLGYAAIMGRCTLNHENIIAKGGGFAAGIGNGFPTDKLDLKNLFNTAKTLVKMVKNFSIKGIIETLTSGRINDIKITGGKVNATGGPGGGAGIGGSAYFYNSTINITGGNVTATGGTYEKEGKKIGGGAGIGGGYYGAGEKISIEGTEKNRPTVTAIGGYGAAAIGGGIGNEDIYNTGNARLIKIGNYSTVTATADNTDGAAIGCGNAGSTSVGGDGPGAYFIQVGSGEENGKGIKITTYGGNSGMGKSPNATISGSPKINIYGGHITFNNCNFPFSEVNLGLNHFDGNYSVWKSGTEVKNPDNGVYTSKFTGKQVFEIIPAVPVTSDNVVGSLEELDNTSTDNKNQDEGKNSNLVDSLVDSKASSKITDSKAFKTGENNNMLVIYILTSTVSLVCVAFVLRKRKSFNK